MKNPTALILSGDGINCEQETALACSESGFQTQIVHVNDLLKNSDKLLSQTNLFVIPGGFSFGDELGSGQILALKLKHGLKNQLTDYTQNMAILGICNGFQVLTRLGVFGKGILLTQNSSGHFQNRWVGLELTGKSIFTDPLLKNKATLELPIRHGEGRLWFEKQTTAQALFENGQCVLRYNKDVNGSWNQVAALSAANGMILGLMPHPEAFWCPELHPWGQDRNSILGTVFFKNAFEFFKNRNEGRPS